MSGPRVRRNEWRVLPDPAVTAWTPTLHTSVVIPCHDAERTLPATLAALAEQSYPDHLLEVVVVDDGGDRPLELPPRRPTNTLVVRTSEGWGPAAARHTGAVAAEGEVLHWLDADMVPERDEVARQLWWHHQLDHAVVLGHKLFVDPPQVPGPDAVAAAVRDGTLAQLLEDTATHEHDWIERFWRSTGELTTAGFRAYQAHVGATASVRKDLYLAAGGMDPSLLLTEDVELGYRLQLLGAVFVGDRAATSLHLGRTNLMRRPEEVERHNTPHVAQRIPDLRKFRVARGRSYSVPFAEVVVDVTGRSFEDVSATVDGVLAGKPGDLRCALVGPWDGVASQGRRSVLDDADLDLRLLREEYGADPRVWFASEVAESAFPAPYRVLIPAGWVPRAPALNELLLDARDESIGLWLLPLPDGGCIRLESTAAFARARRVAGPGEPLDDVVDQVAGIERTDASDRGFVRHRTVGRGPQRMSRGVQTAGPGADPEPPRRAWTRLLGRLLGRR